MIDSLSQPFEERDGCLRSLFVNCIVRDGALSEKNPYRQRRGRQESFQETATLQILFFMNVHS